MLKSIETNPLRRLGYFFLKPKESTSYLDLVKNCAFKPDYKMSRVWQLEVVNQHADGTGRRGAENCGYHAIRNALTFLQFAAHRKTVSLHALKDHQQFLPLYYLWEQKVPRAKNGDRDVSIAIISQIVNEIRQAGPEAPLLHAFQQALERIEQKQGNFPGLSIANALLLDNHLNYAVGGDASSLSAAANLWQIAHEPSRTLDHLFVIGLSDLTQLSHWVTIALHQHEGKREWIFMDSAANQTIHAKRIVEGLEHLMHNKDQFAQEIYENFAGDIISRRAKRLQGLEQNPEEQMPYLEDEQMKHLGLQSARFMLECHWFSAFHKHRKEIQELAYLIHFYSQHLSPSDPLKPVYIIVEKLFHRFL